MADDFKKLPMTRRGFLGTLAGGLAALLGGSRAFKGAKVAEEIIKPVMQAEGMPSWFPLLVNKVRDKGKITRQSDYLEAKQEGINIIEYELKDKSLSGGSIRMTEDLNTGEITIWGRGDEAQQVDLTYTPGDRVINVESGKVTEAPHSFDAGSTLKDPDIGWKANLEKHPVKVKKDGTFEADEFWTGETHDVEVGGTLDDLRGGLTTWEKIANVGSKQSVKEAEEAIINFINRNKKPVEPDFAEGGRVGYAEGKSVSNTSERDLELLLLTDDINPIYMDERKREWFRRRYPMRVIGERSTKDIQQEIIENEIRNMTQQSGPLEVANGGIISKRRDPFYNGMGSLFKERV